MCGGSGDLGTRGTSSGSDRGGEPPPPAIRQGWRLTGADGAAGPADRWPVDPIGRFGRSAARPAAYGWAPREEVRDARRDVRLRGRTPGRRPPRTAVRRLPGGAERPVMPP
ncbi:hypothetical protein Srufu_019630 [Streptomyces libani subsp. rufus]|nr:hypothetical protein Srufu_019630 [Streptomyces libani subsp. rufus]